MTRTLSFIPSPADIACEVGAVPRASPLVLTGPAQDGFEGYTGRLWRRPMDVHTTAPLATAYGSSSDGAASIFFSAEDLALTLTADSGYHDDFWLVVNAVHQADAMSVALRWGWLRVVEAGVRPDGSVLGVSADFFVVDDTCYLTWDEVVYSFPVTLVGESTQPDGTITLDGDMLFLSYGDERFSAPSFPQTPPVAATEGQAVVADDTLYVTVAGVSHTVPVVVPADVPEPPPDPSEPGTTLVTGSDGAEYERTVYEDGTVRYKAVYEELP